MIVVVIIVALQLQVSSQELDSAAASWTDPASIAIIKQTSLGSAGQRKTRLAAKAGELERCMRFTAGDVTPEQHTQVFLVSGRSTQTSGCISYSVLKKQKFTTAAFEYRLDGQSPQQVKQSAPYLLRASQEQQVTFGSIGDSQTASGGKYFDKSGS